MFQALNWQAVSAQIIWHMFIWLQPAQWQYIITCILCIYVIWYNNNCFLICNGKYSPMSKYRGAWEVGAITESNISGSDQKKSYYCIYCPYLSKTPKVKLNYLNANEIRIGKSWRWEKTTSPFSDFVAMVSLWWVRYNGFVGKVFASPVYHVYNQSY